METKASYVAVGAFVLIMGLGVIAFAVWLGSLSLHQNTDTYRIYFTGPVTGLQVGSQVRLRGISVGSVTDIRLDPDNMERVQVMVDLTAGTPIAADSVASLEMQGLTGGIYILIGGGTRGSALLERHAGEPPPVIRSRPSTLQELAMTAPELLDRASQLLGSANRLMSEENQRLVTQILRDVQTLTGAVAAQSASLSRSLSRLESVSVSADGLVAELRVDAARLSDGLNNTLTTANHELGTVSVELRRLTQAYTATAGQLTGLISENRGNIQDFTATGLYEFTLMVAELRGLAQNLSRIATRLETSPAQFLFGDSDQGVRAEGRR